MSGVRIGTVDGLLEPDGTVACPGQPVRVFGDTAIAGGATVMFRSEAGWKELAQAPGLLCAVDAPGGVLVGTEAAHLLRLGPSGLERVASFDTVDGRDEWYTPWGGPPDIRSLTITDHNVLLANVHVGGIPRSDDGGRTWHPTIDLHADVHQVLALPGRPDVVLAAASVGLCRSDDSGRTWTTASEGLHSTYCRAVALQGDMVLVSASEGPRGRKSRLYRRPLDGSAPFEECTDWLASNVDTYWLVADDERCVFAVDGVVRESTDSGTTWTVVRDNLPGITSLSL